MELAGELFRNGELFLFVYYLSLRVRQKYGNFVEVENYNF